MVKISDFAFLSSDGIHQIHYRQWQCEGPVHGVVQLVHGVAEYIDRYDGFASYLAEQGYAVAGCDHLGHGRSFTDSSELGWFSEENGWEHLVEDQKKLHDMLSSQYPGLPMALFGHSMGSFVARTYLGKYPDDFRLAVLSGTGHTPPSMCKFGLFMTAREIRRRGSKYRSKKLQKLAFGGYLKRVENPIGEHDWICRDERVIRQYDADPLCGFTATAGLMRDMLRGMLLISRREHLAKMRKDTPVLFIAGGDDPVGSYGKGVEHVAELFRAAGMRDVSVHIYPAYRHEILNELGKEQVWQDVLRWLGNKRCQGTE